MLTAYVTGADRGLGLALVKVLLEQGYQVFAGQYMKQDWHELTELQAQYNNEHLIVFPLDVADDQSVKSAAEVIKQHTSHLDLLINSAALFLDRSGTILEELYFDDMRRIMETNQLGPLRVTHSVIRLLLKGDKKWLVNIASDSACVSNCWRTKEFAYSMSKSGVLMQSAQLQAHLKEFGVKVFALHPGYVRSYMLGKLNTEATVEPMDSAKGLYEVITTKNQLDGPLFMDYQGNVMPW
jgi:NAD(P)-dependent dehydrogenase (short-subunit alcohol dehydrogenase family)